VSPSSQESPPSPAALEALAARLVEELAAAWHDDRRPPAEEFFARHPELLASPAVASQLIYEEICQREEAGQAGAAAQVVARFPQWREELEVLLDCHRLLQRPELAGPAFPEAGEALGDLRLARELGRGARGRVFLAAQPSLAGRPLVVKVTAREGNEHLSLARLQHTHIVPLYGCQELPERRLRALSMPYLGGATLAQLLAALRDRPPAARTGADLLRELDRLQRAAPGPLPSRSPAREFFSRASYVEAVCILGECLADALQYAHERELVHLDVKPSNVLVAADATPMLLDFHLARAPLRAGQPVPDWFGGTPDYMSPEQTRTLEAVRQRRPVPQNVGPRSDVYALGLVLYEALCGTPPAGGAVAAPLHQRNPHVSRGLSNVVHRCLAPAPKDRYPSAGDLAADLRRHRENRPLRGAREPLGERWEKWRRRRPRALLRGALLALVLTMTAAAAGLGTLFVRDRTERARAALREGQEQLARQHPEEAEATLMDGLTAVANLPGYQDLAGQLAREVRRARRARFADSLHDVADMARYYYDDATLSPTEGDKLLPSCRALWGQRDRILDPRGADLDEEAEERARADLLDQALFWADLRARSAARAPDPAAAREEVRGVLDEAEATFGASPALVLQRRTCAQLLGDGPAAAAAARELARLRPRTRWDRYAWARSLLAAGDLGAAADELTQLLDEEPQAFWPRFHLGVCRCRQERYRDASESFRVCIALVPSSAVCYYNLALAEAASGDKGAAVRDYGRALKWNPGLSEAAQNRAILLGKEP
jgi:tetratricopeptide (TPR) repeat protein